MAKRKAIFDYRPLKVKNHHEISLHAGGMRHIVKKLLTRAKTLL
jgi:hypothetical protein